MARALSLEVADKLLEGNPFVVVLVQLSHYVAEFAAVEALKDLPHLTFLNVAVVVLVQVLEGLN